MNGLKVAHLLRKYHPDEWGGTETAVLRLLRGLQVSGVESQVWAPRIGPSGPDPLAEAGFPLKRFHACLPLWGITPQQRKKLVSVGGNLLSLEALWRLWREPGLDLVHTHTLGRVGGIARTVARLRGLPLVVTIHGGYLDLPAEVQSKLLPPAGAFDWGRPIGWLLGARRVLQDAAAVVTLNPREAQLLKAQYPRLRVEIMPHGLDPQPYQTCHRQCWPDLQDRPVFTVLGRIDRVKNQLWVVQQWPEVLRRHPQALLAISGPSTDEAYTASVRSRVEELGLQQSVIFTGPVPAESARLIGLLQSSRACLLASLSETFGLVILEAWAAGTAVIATATSGARHLIQEGINGRLFELAHPEQFHRALDETFQNTQAMAAAGQALVRDRYNQKSATQFVLSLYQELTCTS